MSSWYPFMKSHLFTHNLNIGVRVKQAHEVGKTILSPIINTMRRVYSMWQFREIHFFTSSTLAFASDLRVRNLGNGDPCDWLRINGWGEPVFSVMTPGWFCEKSGWIGKVEDVKLVLFEKKRISTGNHFEEKDFYPDELWNRRISFGLIHLEPDIICF